MTTTSTPRRRRWPRRLAYVGAALLAIVLVGVIAFQVSPRPGAVVIRWAFDRGGVASNEKLTSRVPTDVTGVKDVAYGDEGSDTSLDVWFPTSVKGTAETLPTVVWVHGGGWVSGDKSQIANYLKILAANGYTVIATNYSLAPGSQYPTPLRQTNEALAYITAHAAELHVDTSRLVLAGDSAGAHIAAQAASVTTSPDYAEQVGISPALTADQLVGTVLNCGPFVPSMVADSGGVEGWFVKTVAWAYTGTKDFDSPVMDEVDLVAHATEDFPTTWISGGNDDPLTEQGEAFAARLRELGVDVTSLFYPADHEPGLGHEYQFDLSTSDAEQALADTVTFLDRVTSAVPDATQP